MINITLLTPAQRKTIVKQCRGLLTGTDRELGVSAGYASRVLQGKITSQRTKAVLEKRIEEHLESGRLTIQLRAPRRADPQKTRKQA